MQKASKRCKRRKKCTRHTKRRRKAQRGTSLLCITHSLMSSSAFSRKSVPRCASMSKGESLLKHWFFLCSSKFHYHMHKIQCITHRTKGKMSLIRMMNFKNYIVVDCFSNTMFELRCMSGKIEKSLRGQWLII